MILTVKGTMQKLVLKKVANVFASTTLARYYSSSLLRSLKIIRLSAFVIFEWSLSQGRYLATGRCIRTRLKHSKFLPDT